MTIVPTEEKLKMAKKNCPECGEPAKRGQIKAEGWALNVEPERRRWTHVDGEPLCPEMTSSGYQPALPE